MSRSLVGQPQRTQNNPLNLGTFSQTTLRYLKGTLGPQWKVVGRADTNQTSNGGIGGGTFNHWFVVTLARPGWIILVKGPPRPKYIQVSAYDLNKTPIQGNEIFQADLNVGSYLICVSSTRNETLEYELGVVVEFSSTESFFALEDFDGSVCLQETEIDAAEIVGPILSNLVITVNSFSEASCEIATGVTVTVNTGVTWYIGKRIPAIDYDNYKIILEVGDDAYYDIVHEPSLSEWQDAWERDHQDTDRFPELFVPLTNRP